MPALSMLIPLAWFACDSPMPDNPPPVEESASSPSAEQVGEDLGFGAVVEEGEDYILFVDEDRHEQEVMKGWPARAPKEPPVAQIVGRDESGQESFAHGIMHFTRWPHISSPLAIWNKEDVAPPDMPDAIGVNERTVRLLTSVKPSFLDVSGWNELPIPCKVYTAEEMTAEEIYEYMGSNRNPGERMTQDGYVEYHRIPPEVLSRPYIFVGARWHVPPVLKDGKMVPEDYGFAPQAHWLFYIADK